MNWFKKTSSFGWLVVAISGAMWLPFLHAKGMFVDGVYNASLARNLAKGIGTFWTPSSNYIGEPVSWGSAPLSTFILSIFYDILGDSYAVERLYSLFCAIFQLVLISALWKSLFPAESPNRKYAWIPCLLFLVSPLTGWCFSNNLMENTMALFTTASIIFLMLYPKNESLTFPTFGAVLIYAALLSKGPVGLFPLAAPLIFFWFTEKGTRKTVLRYFLIQSATFAFICAVDLSRTGPRTFLEHYFELYLQPALVHNSSAASFEIIRAMLIALLPMIGALFISSLTYLLPNSLRTENSSSDQKIDVKRVILFFALGFSASLPILLSTKQRDFYLLPSLPLFAVGFSLIILPAAIKILYYFQQEMREKISMAVKIISAGIILLCLFLSFKNTGIYSQDKELLQDVDSIAAIAGRGAILHAEPEINTESHLFAYLNRLYEIRVSTTEMKDDGPFYIGYSGKSNTPATGGREKVYSGNKFDLYR